MTKGFGKMFPENVERKKEAGWNLATLKLTKVCHA